MEHTQPKPRPLAIWNPETDRWELEQETIFGHSDAYSETWPTSGMTVNGVAYELPTWEHHTADTASSSSQHDEGLLRTPTASEVAGGMMHPDRCKAENKTLRLASQMVELANPGQLSPLLKTPTTQLAVNGGSQHPDKRKAGGHGPTLADEVEHLLPTVTTQDVAYSSGGTYGKTLGQIARESSMPTGESMPRLFVDGKPCEEPPLPLPN